MTGWSVLLRGIRYRSARSLVVLLLAAFATLSVVLIPAYGRAAAQSVLTDGMRSAPVTAASVTVSAESSASGAPAAGFDPAQQPVGEAKALVDQAMRKAPHLAAVLGAPITSVEVDSQLASMTGERFAARLTWRLGACARLDVTGECAIDIDQVVLSERSAVAAGIKVGDTITLRPARGEGAGRQLTVVGLYTPKNAADAYWGNSSYFAHSAVGGEGGLVRLDAAFAGAEDDVRAPGVVAKLTYPLRSEQVRLDDVAALRTELGAFGLAVNAAEMQLETSLLAIADDVAKDQAALGRAVPLIAVPLVLLAWVVLFLLVAALTEARSAELALARLRGFPAARAARFGLGETLLLILLGAPLGLAGGLALVELTCRAMLAPGTHVEPRWPVFATAAAGLIAACVAAWLATRRTSRLGVLTLLRRVPQRAGRRAGVLEAIVGTLAVVGLVAAIQDRSGAFALLAPAALALVAGIVAGRLLTLWAKMRLSIARRRGNVAGILASAQLARRPGTARTVVVLTTAVALLAFAAVSWDAAVRARATHAADTLGAAQVYQVAAAHPEALVAAVAAADPSGNSMAVVRAEEQYNQGRVELIGVQSGLLSQVAQWRGQNRAALTAMGAQLRGDAGKPAAVGADITVRALVSSLSETPMRLGAVISVPGRPPTVTWLGDLKVGQRDYTGPVADCAAGGCRLVGLAVGRSGGLVGPIRATVAVQEIRSAAAATAVRLGDARSWKVATDRSPTAVVQITGGDRFNAVIESSGPGDVIVSYLDTPASLPTVLAGAVPGEGDLFTFPGLADVQQEFSVVRRADRLPRVGDHGLLFDLDLAVRSASTSAGLAEAAGLHYEVWATDQAPPGLAGKLADQGVRVLRTQTLDSELEQLSRRAPALGFRLFLLAGIAAAMLGLGVVALSRRLGAHDRHLELTALRSTGVRVGVLRRAMRRERLAALAFPLLLGLATGVGAAWIMLPGLPLVTAGRVGPAEDLTAVLVPQAALAAFPIAVAGALLVVLFGLFTAGRLTRGTPR